MTTSESVPMTRKTGSSRPLRGGAETPWVRKAMLVVYALMVRVWTRRGVSEPERCTERGGARGRTNEMRSEMGEN